MKLKAKALQGRAIMGPSVDLRSACPQLFPSPRADSTQAQVPTLLTGWIQSHHFLLESHLSSPFLNATNKHHATLGGWGAPLI